MRKPLAPRVMCAYCGKTAHSVREVLTHLTACPKRPEFDWGKALLDIKHAEAERDYWRGVAGYYHDLDWDVECDLRRAMIEREEHGPSLTSNQRAYLQKTGWPNETTRGNLSFS